MSAWATALGIVPVVGVRWPWLVTICSHHSLSGACLLGSQSLCLWCVLHLKSGHQVIAGLRISMWPSERHWVFAWAFGAFLHRPWEWWKVWLGCQSCHKQRAKSQRRGNTERWGRAAGCFEPLASLKPAPPQMFMDAYFSKIPFVLSNMMLRFFSLAPGKFLTEVESDNLQAVLLVRSLLMNSLGTRTE